MRIESIPRVLLALVVVAGAVSACGHRAANDGTGGNAGNGGNGDDDAGSGSGDGEGDSGMVVDDGGVVLQCAPDGKSTLPPLAGAQPFTFQVLGDVHGHADAGSNANIPKALSDLRAIDPNAAALVLNGDLTEHGYASEYSGLSAALAGGSAPRIIAIGNHDYHGSDSSTAEKQRYLGFAGVSSVYYDRTVAGHPFLVLGGENGDAASFRPGDTKAWYAVLSDAQLDWLDQKLTAVARADRPTFVFLHQAPFDSTNPARLKQILAAHPRVIFFWSHWHRDLHNSPSEPNTYTNAEGFLQVHTAAVQYCWDVAQPPQIHYEWAQGLEVSVYPDRVLFRARDFAAHAWIAEAMHDYSLRGPEAVGGVGVNQDGRLELLVAASDGAAARSAQDAAGGAFGGWSNLGGVATSAPAIARNADGRLEAFARGTDNAIYHSTQATAGGAWSAWSGLGGAFASNVAVAANSDGRLEAFARGGDHAMYHSWQATPGGAWSAWASLGGYLTSDPVVARNANGALELFARGMDSALFHMWQDGSGDNGWSDWSSLGGILTSNIAVEVNADGRVEAFARGTDNALYRIAQTAPSGGWTAWASLGGALASDPLVVRNLDGRFEAFARGPNGALQHRAQKSAGAGEWGDWFDLGGTLTSNPIAAVDGDGRVEVFARGAGNTLYQNRQQTAGGCWSGWHSMNGGAVKTF